VKTDEHWKKIGFHPHHGICLPLSSLRTKKSCGIGEFIDLLPLIEWCRSAGFDCLQLLPVNDTGPDPSPFNPISACALDPIYLSLKDLPLRQEDLKAFSVWNALPRLARSEVKNLKMQWLYRYFERTFPSLSKTLEYQSFLAENPWLGDYTAFKAFKDEFSGRHWKDWPAAYGSSPGNKTAVAFYSFLQYHCFSQMKKVRRAAEAAGLFLKGDVPILLSPDSADVWSHCSLFRLDLAAGAPPDFYNANGQNWGFPLYDWEAMRHAGFAWWKQRLAIVERLYQLYRIDHVVGFFRIWGIPEEKKAAEGYFVPTDPALWFIQGRELLEMMLDSCSLLPIAEDLGTIPPEVYPILKELGICGTKVLRWQRRGKESGEFIPYSEYEPFSMTIVSNADLDPLPLWWKKFPEEASAFARFKHWTYEPELSAERQLEILRDSHHTGSYFHINPLQEYLFPFPELVWPNPEEERINIPGTLLPTNWTHRFRFYLEDLVSHGPLKDAIRAVLRP